MKAVINLFDFRYFLGNSQLWLYAYMAIYLLYATTNGLEDTLLATSLIVFAVAPIKPAFLMFVFYILWEYVTIFSFGTTGIMLMQIIMLGKLIITGNLFFKTKSAIQCKHYKLQLALLVYITVVGLCSFVLTDSITGLSFIVKVSVTFYVIKHLYDEKSFSLMLRSIFQILLWSAVIATIYGYFHDTATERWIAEMGGTVDQLYGTLGTTRMAFFYLLSFTYFLYYVSNRVIRYVGLALFTILTLLTVSLTALILLFIIIIIYMYSLGILRRGTLYLFGTLVIFFLTFPFWSKFSFVQPILYRITYSMDAYEQGNTNEAISGREELANEYFEALKESDALSIVFGNARTAMSSTGIEMNSHNTFIDILYFFGIIGIVLLCLYQFRKYMWSRRNTYFYPLLTLKAIILIGASSVSIMTSTYFFFLVFL